MTAAVTQMDLVLWRHAEAEDGIHDSARALTKRGRKQAAQMAKWLSERLPGDAAILVSPARRTLQTAEALDRAHEVSERVGTGASAADMLAAAGWPERGGTLVVVGHQPTLGNVAALLLSGETSDWSIKKGALWWITGRLREGRVQVTLRAAMAPELL
jgi:phosphohistidine phosphatase